ncbi:hypothetical protein NPIL_197171 [Nephila pilipes]|uniref:Uncharacterized protein n=1 Tax=Nephila pilipes TaxID=299642 RepID=A0A8X6QA39_NEPPI|nr:hypothetical protein NPIL_197171 [Nephila pilipes]
MQGTLDGTFLMYFTNFRESKPWQVIPEIRTALKWLQNIHLSFNSQPNASAEKQKQTKQGKREYYVAMKREGKRAGEIPTDKKPVVGSIQVGLVDKGYRWSYEMGTRKSFWGTECGIRHVGCRPPGLTARPILVTPRASLSAANRDSSNAHNHSKEWLSHRP